MSIRLLKGSLILSLAAAERKKTPSILLEEYT